MPISIKQLQLGLIASTFLSLNLLPASINRLCAQTIQSASSDSSKPQADTIPINIIKGAAIDPGIDKNGAQLLKRLPGVVVYDRPDLWYQQQSLFINGMGERYNQVLFNGAPLGSADNTSKAFPFGLIPAEAIQQASVQNVFNPAIPAGATGGTITLDLKDKTEKNFFYILAGAGVADQTNGEDFYGSDRKAFEWLGFPGRSRNLPAGFPSTTKEFSLNQLNQQEQVYWSKFLPNNLAPVNNSAKPDWRGTLGFGRAFKFKKGEELSILGWLTHQQSSRIDAVQRQVAPDLSNSQVRTQSQDLSYGYNAQSSGILTASLSFRQSRISFKGLFGSQYADTYTQRSNVYKPDEDTLARAGMHYATSQRRWVHVNVSGEHLMGEEGKLKLDWVASYSNTHQYNPDERNFLLRIDSNNANLFAIATPSATSLNSIDAQLTNSGRLWRQQRDHNFTGAANLSFPFQLFHYTQRLRGGLFIQSQYRILYSDKFLVNGPGYVTVDNLLSPDRIYPGGVGVTNYFEKYTYNGGINPDAINAKNRGNYTASSNTSAAWLLFDNQLTKGLSVNWGVRFESISSLVSTSQYVFYKTYSNPQLTTLDENDQVIDFKVLPSVTARYRLLNNLELHAAFAKTINRPNLQEMNRYRMYDALSSMVNTGNTLLNSSDVNNYELGANYSVGKTFQFQVNGFYKDIYEPIEYIVSTYANASGNLLSTPHNVPPAYVRGVTAAAQVEFHYIKLFASGTVQRSKVDSNSVKSVSTPEVREHSLSGTPDYTVNAGLVFQHPKYPNLTILYNRTADYITAVGSGRLMQVSEGIVRNIPDYRMKGRDQLDLQLSQRFLKARIQLIAGVTNLTNSDYTAYQDLNGNEKFDGVDNTPMHIAGQRTYYVTLSYLFK